MQIFMFTVTYFLKNILVNCTNVLNGNIGYCGCNACIENDGDCDSDNQCQNGLVCGSKNCPVSLGFNSNTDCCYDAVVWDEDFCSLDNPCGSDEGDCDSNDECQDGLYCGSKIVNHNHQWIVASQKVIKYSLCFLFMLNFVNFFKF